MTLASPETTIDSQSHQTTRRQDQASSSPPEQGRPSSNARHAIPGIYLGSSWGDHFIAVRPGVILQCKRFGRAEGPSGPLMVSVAEGEGACPM